MSDELKSAEDKLYMNTVAVEMAEEGVNNISLDVWPENLIDAPVREE